MAAEDLPHLINREKIKYIKTLSFGDNIYYLYSCLNELPGVIEKAGD